MTEIHWWTPTLADANYAEHLRKDYPYDEHMSDDEILEKYCNGRKYAVTWDHLGDAYEEYEKVADENTALHEQLIIDTLNPNRRTHINELLARIDDLEKQVAHEVYEHYQTCESEGLEWGGEIPEKPEE